MSSRSNAQGAAGPDCFHGDHTDHGGFTKPFLGAAPPTLVLGVRSTDRSYTTSGDVTCEDEREEDAVLYARQVRGEIDNYSLRKRAARPDGTITYLDVFSSSVRDADGRFRYGVRVIQDVTEAQRMEDRLRESERHMRDLLEALPAAVYTTDRDVRFCGAGRESRWRIRLPCRRGVARARSPSCSARGTAMAACRPSSRRTRSSASHSVSGICSELSKRHSLNPTSERLLIGSVGRRDRATTCGGADAFDQRMQE